MCKDAPEKTRADWTNNSIRVSYAHPRANGAVLASDIELFLRDCSIRQGLAAAETEPYPGLDPGEAGVFRTATASGGFPGSASGRSATIGL
jgi:hypothetical protein